MRRWIVVAGVSLSAWMSLAGPSSAAGFVCPQKADLSTTPAVARLSTELPSGYALEQSKPLAAAITLLREHGLSAGTTVDHLLARFCPAVASDGSLSDADKRQRVMRFAQRATRLVHGQNAVDAIIVDVPLTPDVAEAAAQRAKAAGLTTEAWIAQKVEAAIR